MTSQEDQALQALGLPIDQKFDRATRYERAAEFVEIVTAFWDSFPREAITADKENDVYIDTSMTRGVDYQGKHFSSSGILQLPGRYEGERPVMFQAGVSKQSREFGAKYADVLFTSQPDLKHDRTFYKEAKAHAVEFGRNPDHLVVCPGLYAVVGDTEADARKRKAQFDEMLDLNFLVNNLAKQLGLPGSKNSTRTKSFPMSCSKRFRHEDEIINYRRDDIGGVAKANDFTVKELVHHNVNRGQRAIFGTPEQIADSIIEWIDTDVADGFNINVDVQPDGLERFTRVITEFAEPRTLPLRIRAPHVPRELQR